MKYIDEKDVEIVRTLSLMKRFEQKVPRIKEELKQKFENNPKDAQAALNYAIFNLITMKRLMDEADVAMVHISTVFSSLDTVLSIVPDYWLAHLFKGFLNGSFPTSVRNDEMYVDDLTTWIRQQEEVKPESYFAIPYLMFADYYYMEGEKEKAREMIQRAKTIPPQTPVVYLPDFLCMPVKSFLERLAHSGADDFAQSIREIAKKLFPSDADFK